MTLAAIKEDLGLSTRDVALQVGCSPAAVSAVINRNSGRAGLRISRQTRGKIIGTIVGAKRSARAAEPPVQLTDMTRCPHCGEIWEEHADGLITCACGEHYTSSHSTTHSHERPASRLNTLRNAAAQMGLLRR